MVRYFPICIAWLLLINASRVPYKAPLVERLEGTVADVVQLHAQIVCILKGMATALRPPRMRARPAPPATASSAASSEICAAAVLAQSTHGELIGAGPPGGRVASPPPASYAAMAAGQPQGGPFAGGPFAGAHLPNGGAAGPFAGAAACLPGFGSGQLPASACPAPTPNPFAGAATGPSFGSGQPPPPPPRQDPSAGEAASASASAAAQPAVSAPSAAAAPLHGPAGGGAVVGSGAAGPFAVAQQQLGCGSGHAGMLAPVGLPAGAYPVGALEGPTPPSSVEPQGKTRVSRLA